MRKSTRCAILLAFVAVACKPEPEVRPRADDADNAIVCSLNGSGNFESVCRVERSLAGDTLYLIVRHPDGAFRRFEVLKDGRGLAVADGAEPAELNLKDGHLEVAVGLDRYRFPVRQIDHVRQP